MPKSTPLFSIMIPVYKPQYLKECIDSILAQTYRDFELILVNDGSPYDIDGIISLYDDDRLEYHKREKGYGAIRLVNNWNDCLKYVKGEYVINMGDDDKLLPNCLADYVKLIEKYPGLDIYHSMAIIIDDKSEQIGKQMDAPEYESVWQLIWHMWNGQYGSIGDYLFRVDTLRSVGGFYYLPLAWFADRITTYILADKHGMANTKNPGFCFRMSPYHISADMSVSETKVNLWFHEIKSWFEDFLKSHQPDTEEDKKIKEKLIEQLDDKMKFYMLINIKEDVYANHYRWFHWLSKRKKYHLTIRNLLGLLKNGVFVIRPKRI